MHFFNPTPIMALEIIRALQTTDATCDRIVKLTEDVGKKARVSKDLRLRRQPRARAAIRNTARVRC
jgi:3-hydroxyacyl-CoA dehydrogenase